MTSNITFPAVMPVLLLQAFAGANIENRDREEGERRNDENGVEHYGCLQSALRGQNFTRIAKFKRFSIFLRSGVHKPTAPQPPGGAELPSKHTSAPGEPTVLPSGGVTPPRPDQYGTFAARCVNSHRNVMYWLGM